MAKKKAVKKKEEESVEDMQTTFNEDDMSILYDEFGNPIEVEDETDLTGEVIMDDENIEEE